MPRRTVEIDGLLRLKVRNAGERNVEYIAEFYVTTRDRDRIRKLILATGFDSVNIKDIKEKSKPRWQQNPKNL